MSKSTIVLISSGIIALNAVAAALLFALPAKVSTVPPNTPAEPVAAIVATTTATTTPVVLREEVEQQTSVSTPTPTQAEEAVDVQSAHVEERLDVTEAQPVLRQPGSLQIPVHEVGTVLEAMRAYETVSDTFSYGGKEHVGIGFFVTEINGKQEGDGYYWILYVNGKTANLGASELSVEPDDVVEWRYEEGY